MNLEKKRKRQSGRQAKKQPAYQIWIDDAGKVGYTRMGRTPRMEIQIQDGFAKEWPFKAL